MNHYIVTITLSSKRSLEKIEKATIDRMKLKRNKEDAVSTITTVDDSFFTEHGCANAAERALVRIEGRAEKGQYGEDVRVGMELAADVLRQELARYHGE